MSFRPAGFSLIEVLVALLVLCIGLLGIAMLQVQGVRFNYGSYSRSQAVLLASDFAERLYANRPGVDALLYAPYSSDGSVTGTAAVDCAAPPGDICATQSDQATPDVCTVAQMATYDRYVAACGFPIAGGRYGGVTNTLNSGVIRVECMNAAVTSTLNPCTAGAPLRIRVMWKEQGRNPATGQPTVEDVTYELVVRS
jgi:type IV pilus modification protein PilV